MDEDGEAYTVEVDWKAGVLRGLGPYYQKRRLSANETVLLLFRGRRWSLKRPPGRARGPRPGSGRLGRRRSPPPESQKRRVRVTPYPKEVLFPHEPLEPPGATEDLRRLGFQLEEGPPWVYRAFSGRRRLTLVLLRLGEGEVERLKPYRLQGAYTALLAPESQRDRVPEGVGFVSPRP